MNDLLELATPEDIRPISNPEDWRRRREQLKAAFTSILGEADNATPVPLDAVFDSEFDEGDYVRYGVSYNVEADERIPAWLLVPKKLDRSAAGVICLHGTIPEGKDEPAGLVGRPERADARNLARRGFVTLAPDHVAAGARRIPGVRSYDTGHFYARHPEWSVVGKTIWEGQRGLDFLSSLDYVDPARLGAIGHSLGGHGAVFLSALDERVRCIVCSCGITLWERDDRRMDWARDSWYVYFPRLRPLFLQGLPPPCDFHHILAMIAPRACLNITALNDPENFCRAATESVAEVGIKVSQVYDLLDAGARFANYLHSSGHAFPPEVSALAYAWLERWLGTKPADDPGESGEPRC